MDKAQFRREMKQKLSDLTKSDYELYSNDIKNKLINSQEWQEATTIGITISTDAEVDTISIIEEGWSQNKRIVVPKCFPKRKELRFYEINSFADVENSFFHLREPIISDTVQINKHEIELLIVPGLVFDKQGYRIGFGGGYFDRFLTDYNQLTLSLAFHFQIVNEIPKEDYDLPVGKIIKNTYIRFGGLEYGKL